MAVGIVRYIGQRCSQIGEAVVGIGLLFIVDSLQRDFLSGNLVMPVPQRKHQPGILGNTVALELIGDHRSVGKQIDRSDVGGPVSVDGHGKRDDCSGGKGVLHHPVPLFRGKHTKLGQQIEIMYTQRDRQAAVVIHLHKKGIVIGGNQPPGIVVGRVAA
ncbi:hypothetical protein D3C75_686970 [compost metagenome]